MKKYLIAVDLEGIHEIVGEPYDSLHIGTEQHAKAAKNAIKEINAAIAALYDSGAEFVAVWDNHGTGVNLDHSLVDERAIFVVNESREKGAYRRFEMADRFDFDAVVYLGYHSREGSLNGVLAHTYNSKNIQYYKLNGKQVGEFDFDASLAASKGLYSIFYSSDDVAVAQAKDFLPEINTVVTKIGKGRNSAEFIPTETVLNDIYTTLKCAARKTYSLKTFSYPLDFEVRFSRVEDAVARFEALKNLGKDVSFGEDAHVIRAVAASDDDLQDLVF